MSDSSHRDHRPEASALFQSMLLGEWYKAMHLGILAASAGNDVAINKVNRRGTAGFQFHTINIKEK